MNNIVAFVGHSFDTKDDIIVRKFLDFFDTIKDLGIGFSWEHAEEAVPKILSDKVKEIIEGKNLFIGICTVKEEVIIKSANKYVA